MSKYKSLISIIIPVFNMEDKLNKCIQSVINQTYDNLEIILVNDGSKDNSLKICENYKNIDNRIKLISINNNGVSNARNIGIKNATGKYIGFVDSDDYIDNDMFETLYNNIKDNNADLSIIGYQIETIDNKVIKNTNLDKYENIEIMTQSQVYEKILDKNYFQGYCWNKLFKSDLLKDIFFDANIYICEDLLFVCEYLKKCKTIVYNRKNSYHYVYYQNSSWNMSYLPKWATIIDSYERIINIYKNLDKKLETLILYTYFKVNCSLKYRIKKSKDKDYDLLNKVENNIKENYKFIMKSNLQFKKKIEIILFYFFTPFIEFYKASK